MAAYPRLTEPPRQSFFLLGMRGVGKSTWARTAFPGAVHLDLLDERLYQDLLVDPSLFAQSVGHLPPEAWVVVDEVQRLPALLNEVHRLIETRRLRFALLGSSAPGLDPPAGRDAGSGRGRTSARWRGTGAFFQGSGRGRASATPAGRRPVDGRVRTARACVGARDRPWSRAAGQYPAPSALADSGIGDW